LGFKIPQNFNKPYFATSPSDFWSRWHISLSTWLRDYLYIPLGGNKKSPSTNNKIPRCPMPKASQKYNNYEISICSRILHGLYLSIHRVIKHKIETPRFFKTKFGKIISITITQYFVFLAWIPFRVRLLNL